MKKLLASFLISSVLPMAATAQQDSAFVEFKVLKPEFALQMAQAAMDSCRDMGAQVSVAVVDRFGVLQVLLRDRYAGPHSVETATRKAWTAVSFKIDTVALAQATQPQTTSFGIRFISKALPLGGGIVVESAGSMVAGIGVSGAPGPAIDDECAKAGVEAIEDVLGF